VPPLKSLINDDDSGTALRVQGSEIPTAHKTDSHCLEVLHADDIRANRIWIVRNDARALTAKYIIRTGMTFDKKTAHRRPSAKGHNTREACRLDTGNSFDVLNYLPVELSALRSCVAQEIDVERRSQELLRIETRINRLRLSKTSQEESGSDQQYERQGHLRHHKDISQAQMTCSTLCKRLILERGYQIRS
jgi:hypothetical protein